MAIEYYSSIDLNKNELQNAALQVLSTKPGSPATGQVFFDSDVKQVQVYNGSGWDGLATEVVDTDNIFNTALKVGRDADNLLDFTTDNVITFRVGAGDGVAFKASGKIEAASLDISGDVDVDGTLETDALTIGGATIAAIGTTAITTLGTIGTGVWNGAVIASAYLDADTAHLTTEQAFSGAKTFEAHTTQATNTQLRFRDTGIHISSSADGQMDIVADTEIQIAATTIDINGAVVASGDIQATSLDINGNADISGVLTGLDKVTSDNFVFGGHTINDIDIGTEFVDADDHIMTSGAIVAKFGLIAGSSSLVTTGVLNSGSINTSFGNINNGASTITTTGLITGGSLIIDDVHINGSNIGHADDADLIALANGAVTVNGSLTVTGTTTTNNVETVSTSSGVIFEGAAADGHDATLKSVVASSDKTYTLPNITGFVPILTNDPSTTAISSTVAELNLVDGSSAGGVVNSKAVIYGSSGEVNATTLQIGGTSITSTAAELNKLDGATVVVGEINMLDLGSTAVGTAIASKAVVLDSNKDYTGVRHFTLSGELDAGSLDVSGNADIDGTLETDALTIGGAAVLAQATASAVGAVELATAAEVLTGTDTARVVTADTLAARSVRAEIAVSELTDANIVTIPHNLGTAEVLVQVYDASTKANIMCDIARTTDDFSTASTSSISIDFGTAPPNDCICLITSLKGASASGTVAYT